MLKVRLRIVLARLLGLEVRSLRGLAGTGVAMVLLFGLMRVFYVYRNAPDIDLRGRRAQLRAWRGL